MNYLKDETINFTTRNFFPHEKNVKSKKANV